MSNLNGTPVLAPKKKVNAARNLTGFAGEAAVALAGGVLTTPFMAGEVICSMAGDMLMLLGKGIMFGGLGVAWVGKQSGTAGDVVVDKTTGVYDKVRAWRTGEPVAPRKAHVSPFGHGRAAVDRALAQAKEEVRQVGENIRAGAALAQAEIKADLAEIKGSPAAAPKPIVGIPVPTDQNHCVTCNRMIPVAKYAAHRGGCAQQAAKKAAKLKTNPEAGAAGSVLSPNPA